jgi:hypothetical protein
LEKTKNWESFEADTLESPPMIPMLATTQQHPPRWIDDISPSDKSSTAKNVTDITSLNPNTHQYRFVELARISRSIPTRGRQSSISNRVDV